SFKNVLTNTPAFTVLPCEILKIIFSYSDMVFADLMAVERTTKQLHKTINVNSLECNIWLHFLKELLPFSMHVDVNKPLKRQIADYIKLIKAAGFFDEIKIAVVYVIRNFFTNSCLANKSGYP